MGDVNALFELGYIYDNGSNEISCDFKKSFKYYHKAALKGHPVAQCFTGIMYDFGDGVNPDTLPHTGWIEWLDMSDSLGIPVIMGFIAGEASIKKFHQGTDKEIANRAVKELAAWAETRRLMDSRKPRKKEL